MWYAIVSSRNLRSYLDCYRAMTDPLLEPMPAEGPDCARLASSTFAPFSDYEEVLNEARELIEIMTGTMKLGQGVQNLLVKKIIAVRDDNEIEEFPPYGRPMNIGIILGRPVQKPFNEGEVRETIEKSTTLFALRCENPYVREVLREFAQSDDWINLYRIMETVILDLNEHDPNRKRTAATRLLSGAG